jgi:hypothetical protein
MMMSPGGAAFAATWHPHNYKTLSGQLVAPGIPDPVEHQVMSDKVRRARASPLDHFSRSARLYWWKR